MGKEKFFSIKKLSPNVIDWQQTQDKVAQSITENFFSDKVVMDTGMDWFKRGFIKCMKDRAIRYDNQMKPLAIGSMILNMNLPTLDKPLVYLGLHCLSQLYFSVHHSRQNVSLPSLPSFDKDWTWVLLQAEHWATASPNSAWPGDNSEGCLLPSSLKASGWPLWKQNTGVCETLTWFIGTKHFLSTKWSHSYRYMSLMTMK